MQEFKMATHQQEMLMIVSRHLRFLTKLSSHNVNNSFIKFFALENICIVNAIVQLR